MENYSDSPEKGEDKARQFVKADFRRNRKEADK